MRVGAAYPAVAWLVVQVVESLFPVFGLGDLAIRAVVILLVIGFVPVLLLAWFFEWAPEAIKHDAEVDHDPALSRRLTRRVDGLLAAALLLAVGFFTYDKFVLEPERDVGKLEAAREQAREEGRTEASEQIRDNSIAVLPFDDLSAAGDQQFFFDGLAQDILNDLSRNAQLRVTARTSAFSFRGTGATIAEIGAALNVAHVLEGSISQPATEFV